VLLIAYKFIYKNKKEEKEINLTIKGPTHPHIWKSYDDYYGKNKLNK